MIELLSLSIDMSVFLVDRLIYLKDKLNMVQNCTKMFKLLESINIII